VAASSPAKEGSPAAPTSVVSGVTTGPVEAPDKDLAEITPALGLLVVREEDTVVLWDHALADASSREPSVAASSKETATRVGS
jgi:hypothetical protein